MIEYLLSMCKSGISVSTGNIYINSYYFKFTIKCKESVTLKWKVEKITFFNYFLTSILNL